MGDTRSGVCDFVVSRRLGVQPTFDIAAIARELAALPGAGRELCVLLDWSCIETWPFKPAAQSAIIRWREAPPEVARVAILHDANWNRHAALLSALLRISDVEVRSFAASERAQASRWLGRRP